MAVTTSAEFAAAVEALIAEALEAGVPIAMISAELDGILGRIDEDDEPTEDDE